MQYFRIGAAAVAVLLGLVPSAWGDSTTSPGRTAVYVDKSGVPITLSPQSAGVTGTIIKGKRGHVLEIDLTLIASNAESNALGVFPHVNGFTDVVHPKPSFFQWQLMQCTGFQNCTVSGHFWVDLDAAETAHPGMFIQRNLVIELFEIADIAVDGTGDASLRARLRKK